MSHPNDGSGKVVNWDPPSKRDLVERAISDGMTATADIIAFAKGKEVHLTAEEVEHIKAELQKKKPHKH